LRKTNCFPIYSAPKTEGLRFLSTQRRLRKTNRQRLFRAKNDMVEVFVDREQARADRRRISVIICEKKVAIRAEMLCGVELDEAEKVGNSGKDHAVQHNKRRGIERKKVRKRDSKAVRRLPHDVFCLRGMNDGQKVVDLNVRAVGVACFHAAQ